MSANDETESDLVDDRVPCPDGICVGILGEDGVCGTCGARGEAPPGRKVTASSPKRDEGVAIDPPQSSKRETAEGDDDGEDGGRASGDDDDRVPCEDGMCTGLIGKDGVCGTCGKSAA